MKKIISVIIVCVLLSFLLVTPASAAYFVLEGNNNTLRFYNASGNYHLIDASHIDVKYYEDRPEHVFKRTDEYTFDDPRGIRNVTLKSDASQNIICAETYYNDGTRLTSYYINEKYFSYYEAFLNDAYDTYTAEFTWPQDNTVKFNKSVVSDKIEYLYKTHFDNATSIVDVSYRTDDDVLVVQKGALVILEDKCYFVKYDNYTITSLNALLQKVDAATSYSSALAPAYEITDQATLQAFKNAESRYFNEDFGFLYNQKFTDTLSAIFLVFLFGVIPLAVFVVFLILAIRSKTIYKKMFTAIYISSATMLGIAILLALFIFAG